MVEDHPQAALGAATLYNFIGWQPQSDMMA